MASSVFRLIIVTSFLLQWLNAFSCISAFALSADDIIKMKKAGLSDETIQQLIGMDIDGPEKKNKLSPVKEKSSVSKTPRPPQKQSSSLAGEKIMGMEVLPSFLSVPMEWKYLQVSEQYTLAPWGWPQSLSETFTQKVESFSQPNVGLRLAKTSDISKSISVGVELGILASAVEEKFSFYAPKIVSGSTVTVISPWPMYSIYPSTMGPTSLLIEYDSNMVPLFAKINYKTTDSVDSSFNISAGVGAYVMIWKYKTTYKSPRYSGENNRLNFAKIVPSVELALDARWKLSNRFQLTVGGSLGMTQKTKILSIKGSPYYNNPPYESWFQMGGVLYGGRIGLLF